jgi:hypothetical protein
MDHLDHVQQIILSQLNQTFSQLLHIDSSSNPLPLLLRSLFAILVTRNRATFTEKINERGAWVLEGNNVLCFVPALGKVKVMVEGVLPTFLGGVEVNSHIEFSPALILASKWCIMER